MKKLQLIFAALTILWASPIAAQNYLEQLEEIAIVDQKVMMPMRDGIRLATDIYRPKTDAPVPIIFVRTPYNFNSWGDGKERSLFRST